MSVRATALAILLIAAGAALLLVAPAQTVSVRYLNDLMMFLDGAYRIAWGQIPHVDFHTPMGPVTNLIPAFGFWVTESLGAAMPVGLGALTLVLAPVMAHVLSSRLHPALALPLALYLVLILTAPTNLGESPKILTFAMFYNRIGWVELSLLLCMVLPPRGRRELARDAICAAGLTLLTVYMKASYAAVALAFLGLMLLDKTQRAWAAAALLATLAVTVLLETVWRLPSAYLADVIQAIQASGAVKGGAESLLVSFRDNLFDYAAFALVLLLALATLRDLRVLLFLAFCGGAGLMILNQNFQVAGVATLALGAVVVAEFLARRRTVGEQSSRSLACASILVAALLCPMILDRAIALEIHVALATTSPAYRFSSLPGLDRIILPNEAPAEDKAYTAKYVETLEDGARVLAASSPRPTKVAVLDFVNPFSAGLRLAPPRGDYSVSDFGRTYDKVHFLPAETVLGDAEAVMDPKWPLGPAGRRAFLELYSTYLASHFRFAAESDYWRVYTRRGRPPGDTAAMQSGQGPLPAP